MSAFTLKCLQLLIFWVKWPLQQMWKLINGEGGSISLWLMLAGLICVAGLITDIVLHYINLKNDRSEQKQSEQSAKKTIVQEQKQAVFKPDFSVFHKKAETPESIQIPTPAVEDHYEPVFDEPLPPMPEQQPVYESTSVRRRRPLRENYAPLQNAVPGGKQTIHSMEEMEHTESSGRLSRLAHRAMDFVNLGGEGEGISHSEYQSRVKRSEAFFDPVYPDSYHSNRNETQAGH